jgi:hypothetical protein
MWTSASIVAHGLLPHNNHHHLHRHHGSINLSAFTDGGATLHAHARSVPAVTAAIEPAADVPAADIRTTNKSNVATGASGGHSVLLELATDMGPTSSSYADPEITRPLALRTPTGDAPTAANISLTTAMVLFTALAFACCLL